MKFNRLTVFLIAIFVTATSFTVFGRKIENWSYERLLKESDLVVIATPIKSTESPDRIKLNWDAEFVGLNTTFNVQCILKGKVTPSGLTVLHYKTKANLNDGPMLVVFRTKELVSEFEKENNTREKKRQFIAGPVHYLLFLKKQKDGRFAPTSGQVDAALSVKELRAGIMRDNKKIPLVTKADK